MQCTFALSELPAYSYHYDGPEWPVSQVTENDFVAKVQKNACFNRTVQICQGRAIFQAAKVRLFDERLFGQHLRPASRVLNIADMCTPLQPALTMIFSSFIIILFFLSLPRSVAQPLLCQFCGSQLVKTRWLQHNAHNSH